MLVQLTRVQPLYGVLQIKDELINTNDLSSNDINSNTSLLPLISSVIQNMQVIWFSLVSFIHIRGNKQSWIETTKDYSCLITVLLLLVYSLQTVGDSLDLPFSFDDDALYNQFSSCGEITDTKVQWRCDAFDG